ncbi:umecyanin-like isoform X2 [Prunus yedoensis var. nudiflora]|uniref:Umecyanin-like isoform X2 n=1 Tax=Prunus yedoensis var. nudiflora TaxID=2094558 RepID=A0A314Y157_PRUYE|nr:umecyanin-like isoform X2 [Prunus yedoensis var. nudiflora]
MLLVTAWAGLFPRTPLSIPNGLPQRLFNWTGDHYVGPASKEEYDNCTDPGIVFGPGVKINITSTDTLYFICTVGDHCERGQKVTITVGSAANNSSPPPPPPSYASSLTPTTLGSFFGLIISILVAISFLNHS